MTLRRRDLLATLGTAPLAAPALAQGAAIALLVDPQDRSAPVSYATAKLGAALGKAGARLSTDAGNPGFTVVVAREGSPLTQGFAAAAAQDGVDPLRLVPGTYQGKPAILVSGRSLRGLVYGLLELAERAEFHGPQALHLDAAIEESSPNIVRSVARAFCSEIEDKAWYYDKQFWTDYLDGLAAARFNRFNLAFGFGYDFPKGVTGDYFHFPYPYLVEVPGFDVKITPALPPGEREKNMEMLRFIARETGRRGLDFQLGIWTHAWAWTDSPHSDHVITGLKDWTDGARYCRDALKIILQQCPEITGVTLRVHGESGVPEGTYDFWRTLFEAFKVPGRPIEVDMHAKGINQIMIDMALQTGQQVKVGAKYSAEHQSLGYHQADIRELEIPTPARMESGVFAVSNGERRFTRYGYADLYQEGRAYDVLFRLWPGTQRHLLSGDPALAAAYGRSAHFCNASGLEFCEPLTFKGREGSGHPGGRNAYARAALDTKQDWRKFAESYRLWGRLLYNPEAEPDAWRRGLVKTYGDKAAAAEAALAPASRVLPLLTSASLPSASNHSLWYEVYSNQDIVIAPGKPLYSDTPAPFDFGACSPLDPQLFASINEHAANLLEGKPSAKYTPIEVALWLDDLSAQTQKALPGLAGGNTAAARLEEDVRIQRDLARFFAGKLRAGVYFALWQKTKNAQAGKQAIQHYQHCRDIWAGMANRAKTVYVADISYGDRPYRRGHWLDRLPAIEQDLARMQAAVASEPGTTTADAVVSGAGHDGTRAILNCRHAIPDRFDPGAALPLSVQAPGVSQATLFYRHVNQGERWLSMPMLQQGDGFAAAIPAAYTNSPYPLQYYFAMTQDGKTGMWPGFNASLSNTPYCVVWRRR